MNIPSIVKDYEKISFVKHLGIKITEISDNSAIGTMKITKKMKNYMELLHGGVVASLIDTVAFFPGKLLPAGLTITTISLEVKYIRPVSVGEILTAIANIVHLGKKIGVIEVDVFNSEDKLISKGIVTVLVLK
ncbi:MAG: PaaI family thioesterase [Proteobacteria bacterium]|nr:PaaI family thioesterase [Pseudomonadota bacterium]